MSSVASSLDHPLRQTLSDEVHARPSDHLPSPCAVSYLARLSDRSDPAAEHRLLCELLAHLGLDPPPVEANHFSGDTGQLRLRWEKHTEFARYAITVVEPTEEPFTKPPSDLLPAAWLEQLRESILVAAHTRVLAETDPEFSLGETSERYFGGNVLVGSQIAAGAAIALTDFHIHEDGFSRILVLNDAMSPLQTGRMVQRLLELDTYRMMTLLALPEARSLAPELARMEQELSAIAEALSRPGREQDQPLLKRLMHLEAESEKRRLHSQYRFAAAEAYYDLVQQRGDDLREQRIRGLQTFDEFIQRRLAPAVKTCRATASRHQAISDRMARASQLLETRVSVERQRQNQTLLSSMNERAQRQLQLQATVEGLSVAAITYYVVGLVYYLLKGLSAGGLDLNESLLTATSIPLVASAIFLAVRRIRRRLDGKPAS